MRREQYVAERVDVAEQLLERISQIDDEIADAGSEDAARLQVLRDGLADQYDRLNISADLASNASARVIDEANLPAAAFSPQVARNLVLGGVLGLILGVGAALLLESLDRSVRSREVIEATTPGVPSLAVVPVLRSGSDMVTLTNPGGVESEVFGTLRAASSSRRSTIRSRCCRSPVRERRPARRRSRPTSPSPWRRLVRRLR